VLQVVAGALVEGNEEDEDDAAAGNAGSWIKVELMLEEVRSITITVRFSKYMSKPLDPTSAWAKN
jgi:hypothetical protein